MMMREFKCEASPLGIPLVHEALRFFLMLSRQPGRTTPLRSGKERLQRAKGLSTAAARVAYSSSSPCCFSTSMMPRPYVLKRKFSIEYSLFRALSAFSPAVTPIPLICGQVNSAWRTHLAAPKCTRSVPPQLRRQEPASPPAAMAQRASRQHPCQEIARGRPAVIVRKKALVQGSHADVSGDSATTRCQLDPRDGVSIPQSRPNAARTDARQARCSRASPEGFHGTPRSSPCRPPEVQ